MARRRRKRLRRSGGCKTKEKRRFRAVRETTTAEPARRSRRYRRVYYARYHTRSDDAGTVRTPVRLINEYRRIYVSPRPRLMARDGPHQYSGHDRTASRTRARTPTAERRRRFSTKFRNMIDVVLFPGLYSTAAVVRGAYSSSYILAPYSGGVLVNDVTSRRPSDGRKFHSLTNGRRLWVHETRGTIGTVARVSRAREPVYNKHAFRLFPFTRGTRRRRTRIPFTRIPKRVRLRSRNLYGARQSIWSPS